MVIFYRSNPEDKKSVPSVKQPLVYGVILTAQIISHFYALKLEKTIHSSLYVGRPSTSNL
jgi:hypothetical protein